MNQSTNNASYAIEGLKDLVARTEMQSRMALLIASHVVALGCAGAPNPEKALEAIMKSVQETVRAATARWAPDSPMSAAAAGTLADFRQQTEVAIGLYQRAAGSGGRG